MPLHSITPLFKHFSLSNELNKNIWLKMDCYQPVLSFKIRGIGRLCEYAKKNNFTHLVSASGGNAGYATAYAGYHLGMKVTVFMPTNAAIATQEKLKKLGANVVLAGESIEEAQLATDEYIKHNNAFFVHPFNNPLIWEGHSTIIDELVEQMPYPPDAIVMSVGGGGLMCGIIQGLEKHNWHNVKIITSETHGTNSLKQSVDKNQLIHLDKISGIATSLGAKSVAQQAFNYTKTHNIQCVSVSDEQSLQACITFAQDENVLVEPACGATLALAYQNHPFLHQAQNIVLIVCGGINTQWLDISSKLSIENKNTSYFSRIYDSVLNFV